MNEQNEQAKGAFLEILTLTILAILVTALLLVAPERPEINDPYLEELYNATHPALTKGLRSINYVDEITANRLINPSISDTTTATYGIALSTISIKRPNTNTTSKAEQAYNAFAVKHAYAHELGHHVWKKLTIKERQEYAQAYESDPYRPTPYANTSLTEDFADSFATHTTENPYIHLGEWRTEFLTRTLARIISEHSDANAPRSSQTS